MASWLDLPAKNSLSEFHQTQNQAIFVNHTHNIELAEFQIPKVKQFIKKGVQY